MRQAGRRWRNLTVTLAALVLSAAGAAGTASAAEATGSDVTLAATPGCGKAPTLSSGTHTISSGGKSRSFILSVPGNYDVNRNYRLVFGFHWWGGTANDVASGGSDGAVYAYYGLRALANDSTIFVAPQGISNGWANTNGEDVTFTDDMIRRIGEGLCVDTGQIFSLGFSYGGAMSYSLACSRPTVFKAVAAIAAPGEISGCSGGTQPVAYMGIHGVSDNIGAGRSLRDRFVRNNGCTPQNAPEPAAGSRTHISTTYSGCRAGYPVVWAAFDGGHQQGPVDGCAGCESGARSWVKGEVWKFFTGETPPAPTTFRLRGEASGRCIDVEGANSANGTATIIWDCHTNANQQFTQNGQTLRVLGKCLDVPDNATTGTRARIWDCTGGTNQQWTFNTNGTISNVRNGLCLDVSGAATANGSSVILWTCHTGANQRWAKA
ncbi:ricin-type beta-trefoil lectin domain protein [Saccharothrix variisporea]|uniref:Poly(3-hydroxybutyrate) depolymerase n=1 Tax=Saccharothrix variisporea TaxID=543527 RepID=A0A495X5J1_9PSEU|nr:ricin-type beta-trefoil lectin domain protein [Saccharothrix variisporea]RKT67893.1 poly(3-hydroxybutyrate) depolymerase [Saccharothrix variisporea]